MAERLQLLLVDRNERQAQLRARSLETITLAVTAALAVPGHIGVPTAPPVPDLVCCCARPREEALADCRALRALLPTAPIIVYGGDPAHETTRLRFLEAGADEFVRDEELMTAVAACLPDAARSRAPKPAAEASPSETGSRMLFSLHAGEISNVVQFLSYSTRTGVLVLTFQGAAAPGRVFFENGQVVHVEDAGGTGVDGLAAMFLRGDSEGRFFDGVSATQKSVQVTTSHLLMEAVIRADERGATAVRGQDVKPE